SARRERPARASTAAGAGRSGVADPGGRRRRGACAARGPASLRRWQRGGVGRDPRGTRASDARPPPAAPGPARRASGGQWGWTWLSLLVGQVSNLPSSPSTEQAHSSGREDGKLETCPTAQSSVRSPHNVSTNSAVAHALGRYAHDAIAAASACDSSMLIAG